MWKGNLIQKESFESFEFAAKLNQLPTDRSLFEVDTTSLKKRLKDSLYLDESSSLKIAQLFTSINDENILKDSIAKIVEGIIKVYQQEDNRLSIALAASTEKVKAFVKTNLRQLDEGLQEKIIKHKADSKKDYLAYEATAFYNPAEVRAAQNVAADSLYSRNETFSLTNFRMPSQTEVIDALAIYLAKRFKQEVALTLVDQFRKILKNDQLINDLFPETYKMFSSGKVYEMPSFGTAWNYAIGKDFTELLPNLSKSSYLQKKIGDSNYVSHLKNVIQLCKLINNQYSYTDAISQLYHQRTPKTFFSSNITTLYIINKELFDTVNTARFWVSAEQVYSLQKNQLELFYELIKEKYKGDLGTFTDYDWLNSKKLERPRNMISATLVLLNNFQAQRRKFLAMQSSMQTIQTSDYWNFLNLLFETINTSGKDSIPKYVQRFLNISDYCFETYSLLTQKNYAGAALKLIDMFPALRDNNYIDLPALLVSQNKYNRMLSGTEAVDLSSFNQSFDMLSSLLREYLLEKKLYLEIVPVKPDYRYLANDPRTLYLQKKFRLAVTPDRNTLLSRITSDTAILTRDIKNAVDLLAKDKLYQRIQENDLYQTVSLLMKSSDDPEVINLINQSVDEQFNSFRKITGFLSDFLIARDSKNLSLVIEKYAMPANSYKIKRTSRRSWDLNAYVGGYVGGEVLSSKGSNNLAPVYGFSAPIGIAYSWGKRTKNLKSVLTQISAGYRMRNLKGNAVTLNLTLVDIGAVVAYRITNDASKGLPEQVKWSQFISPGLHIRYGIKDTPLCLSFGVQSTPELRSFDDAGSVSSVRGYAGLFFDLPLYNISHR